MMAVRERGENGDFLGHIGGDDFVVVTTPLHGSGICKTVVERFDATIGDFYDEDDRKRKSIQVENRSGRLENFPIMTITMAVISGSGADLESTHLIAERAAELKKHLKRLQGSNFMLETREARDARSDEIPAS
jgi:GGDEF domain-containing protein